jgi:hypothetical protein
MFEEIACKKWFISVDHAFCDRSGFQSIVPHMQGQVIEEPYARTPTFLKITSMKHEFSIRKGFQLHIHPPFFPPSIPKPSFVT